MGVEAWIWRLSYGFGWGGICLLFWAFKFLNIDLPRNIWGVFLIILQVHVRVTKINYPSIPAEQDANAQPFAPMQIIVSYTSSNTPGNKNSCLYAFYARDDIILKYCGLYSFINFICTLICGTSFWLWFLRTKWKSRDDITQYMTFSTFIMLPSKISSSFLYRIIIFGKVVLLVWITLLLFVYRQNIFLNLYLFSHRLD